MTDDLSPRGIARLNAKRGRAREAEAVTRDDLRPAAIAMAETWHHEACKFKAKGSRQCQFWSAHVRTIEGFLDALTPSAKSTLARYLLGDAIDGLDAAWAAAEAALPEGWALHLGDYGPPGPFNPGPGQEFHTPRYEASAILAILSSLPKHYGRSDESPAAALRTLAADLAEPKP